MYEREKKMMSARDAADTNYKSSTQDFVSSEDESGDEEENYAWYRDPDSENYFCLHTGSKMCIEKNDQVYICYGRRSNRYLLSAYGFTLAQNKYNTLSFRVWLDFN